jgi:hypothetical protein
MSHLYGWMKGSRGEVTRCGSKKSGLSATLAGWQGAIKVQIYYDEDEDEDKFEVYLTGNPKCDSGQRILLADGILNNNKINAR